ncbi:imm11 family protein [Croceibacterium aestuarii]|uniref:imm11 family protein n=1 Tax=Croceibacterium aestuarii TaxID=3064139 RepID=UPI00272E64FE|nr:DUF1629 domain-containing protein [Croceibacterium sp. D39]
MAWAVQMEYGAPRRPDFKWDDRPETLALFGFSHGRVVDDLSMLPTRATQKDKKKLCDVFPMPGLNAVSAKFKSIVEEFEPDTHQFFPISLNAKDGTPYEEEYFIFNACQRFDAILPDQSKSLHWSEKKAGEWKGMPFLNGTASDLVLSRPAIGDHHLWVSRLILGGHVFFSDPLKARMEKEKVRYVLYDKAEEVDRDLDLIQQIRPTKDWLVGNQRHWVEQNFPEWLHAE